MARDPRLTALPSAARCAGPRSTTLRAALSVAAVFAEPSRLTLDLACHRSPAFCRRMASVCRRQNSGLFSGSAIRSISRRGLASLSRFHCGRSARGLKGARCALPKRFSPRSCRGAGRNSGRSPRGLNGARGAPPKGFSPRSCRGAGRNSGRSPRGLNGARGALPKRFSPRSCRGAGRNSGRSPRGLNGARGALPKRFSPRSCRGAPRNSGRSPRGLNGARGALPKGLSPRSGRGAGRNSGRSPRGLNGARGALPKRFSPRSCRGAPRNSGRASLAARLERRMLSAAERFLAALRARTGSPIKTTVEAPAFGTVAFLCRQAGFLGQQLLGLRAAWLHLALGGQPQRVHLIFGELAHVSRLHIEHQRPVAHAANLFGKVSDGRKHFSQFAIASLGQNHLKPGVVAFAELGERAPGLYALAPNLARLFQSSRRRASVRVLLRSAFRRPSPDTFSPRPSRLCVSRFANSPSFVISSRPSLR